MRRETEGPVGDGRAAAEAILARLLDRFENQPDRKRRIIEPAPLSALADARRPLEDLLERAAGSGAVVLERNKRDGRIDRVILSDAAALYGILDRERPATASRSAEAEVLSRWPKLSESTRVTLSKIAAAWAIKRNLIRGIGPNDVDDVIRVLRAAEALLEGRITAGMDIRTFSRRTTLDSKFVESNLGRVADALRLSREFPDYEDAEELLNSFGIAKFPHAYLLSGPVSYKGVVLPTEPYIGIAPEMTPHIGLVREPAWILTIENLASFNRQVREAAGDGNGVVVYTGGFPSDATLRAILTLARETTCAIHHWGDIDAGGVKIAYRIEQELGSLRDRFQLHMMSADIATRFGTPAAPQQVFKTDVGESAVRPLVEFLASTEARVLEQEELDPVNPK